MRLRILFFVFIGTVNLLSAQSRTDYKSINYREFANKPFFFGLSLGYNQNNFKIYNSGYFLSSDSIRGISSAAGRGFNVSVISNLKVGEFFDFRLLPTFVFTDRTVTYDLFNKNELVRKGESVMVEIPFQVRYKTQPYRDVRAYVLGGVKYSFDVSSKNRNRDANAILKIAPTDYAIEFGGGLQFYLPFFIFSPEIKFSHGLNNLMIYKSNAETSLVVDKLFSRVWTISFHFEG
jgi:hypothetical protein